ncbi:type VII secretion integral membrane protein EccD [Phytohabitans sp. ZYX-F-186]|uniref:Type VII secretion integral membrane protein EccD n=1 Tax=Phytohabitans maris TaxID=3071409 RepID=A0ABU0ZSB4_9ACTN|nr:type VII secretion integral membrane protein EccD [Phytohabitans sp. ZYX-F-186]MDQ7909377.1 type VII secretion integral membrane protein EccD [Phytohabitans sp. ZYX-F-186]
MEPLTSRRIAAPVRLRFVLGARAVDLALPGEVPLADVLPAVLPQLSPDAPDRGAEHDGWVVQRLGEPPLDEERTAAELNLLDGEALHLRPRAEQLPPIDFDDLVDGVAEQARTSPHRWTVPRTRWMLLVFGGLLLGAGLVPLALAGPAGVRATVAAATAVLLLAAAGLVSRAVPDAQTGTLLAGAATAYAAVGGWLGADVLAPHSAVPVRASLAVLAALVVLAAGLALVGDSALLFTGALVCAGCLAVPAVLSAAGGLAAQSAAACGLVVTLVVTVLLPPAAFRLGGLELPLLPGKPEQLAENIEPAPYQVVVERGPAGLAYLAALTVGVGVAQTVVAGVLVAPGGRWPMILAVAVAALLFMRARHLTGTVARWAIMVPAAGLVLFDLVRYAADRSDLVRAAVVAPVAVAVAGALLTAAATLPGRRLRPYWGRAVDILEIVIAVALVPLLGAVLGVYQMVRAWAS